MNQAEMTIEEIAEEYIRNNALSKQYDKIAGELKTTLKEYIPKHAMEPIQTDRGTVVLSYRSKDIFKEDILIEAFKNDPIMKKVVRTKEYIDFDILESLMYHEEVSEEMLNLIASNKTTSKTAVLTVRKSKKKGE